jgi:hypothetical protein
MYNEQLDPDDLSPAAIEHLDQRIVRALETVSTPQIPADFATRVANRLPAGRPISLTPTHFGQNAILIGVVVTLAALLILALHTTHHASFGLLESLLFAQFIVFAVWFGVGRHSLR